MRLGMALALGVAYLAVGCSDDPAETSTTGGVGGGGTGGSGAGTAGSAGVAGSSVGGTAGAAGTGGVAGAGGTGGAPQDWLDVCADQATQVCERYETCWGDLMGSFYGTRADCEQSWSNYCASQWREDGTSASETSACSAALASQLGSDCVAFGLWFNNGTAEPNFPRNASSRVTPQWATLAHSGGVRFGFLWTLQGDLEALRSVSSGARNW